MVNNDQNFDREAYLNDSESSDFKFDEYLSHTDKLKSLLRLGHLNSEEKFHIEELVEKYSEQILFRRRFH